MVWNILEEIFWWKGVEGNGRMENVVEYGGRKWKERKRKKKRKGKKRRYLIRIKSENN